MAKVNVQVFIDKVAAADQAAIRDKIQDFIDDQPGANMRRFAYTEEATAKINIHISVANVALTEVEAVRQKVQNFLDSVPGARLTLFACIEE